jgi:hypothetical protein
MRHFWLRVVCLSIGLIAAAAAQTGAAVRLRGTAESIDGAFLKLRTTEGNEVSVKLADDLVVAAVAKASLSDIKPGVFVGTGAAIEPGGGLRAIQIIIFPEAMRGRGEGHRPWSAQPDSTMTNATVADTVDTVSGRTMRVHYKGGEKSIVIPAEATILRLLPAERHDLGAGARVAVTASTGVDGTLTASRVVIAREGAEPPL